MIDTPVIRRPREGTWLWLYKIIAGLLIVILLGTHFFINHMLPATGLLNYDEIVALYQTAIYPKFEIIFLTVAISHSLVGLRSILLDLNPSDKVLKISDAIMWIAGISFSVYGVWLVWVLTNL